MPKNRYAESKTLADLLLDLVMDATGTTADGEDFDRAITLSEAAFTRAIELVNDGSFA